MPDLGREREAGCLGSRVARGTQRAELFNAWSRELNNSAIECRVLWNQLPKLGKDCSRATGLWAGWIVPQRQRCYARGGTAQPGKEALHCGANAPATPRQDELATFRVWVFEHFVDCFFAGRGGDVRAIQHWNMLQ